MIPVILTGAKGSIGNTGPGLFAVVIQTVGLRQWPKQLADDRMAAPSLDDKRKQKEAGDFFMAGKVHFKNKEISQAVDAFTHAIMLRPEKAEYFYNRGNCYNKMGETQKALLDYSMAIRIDNKMATYY